MPKWLPNTSPHLLLGKLCHIQHVAFQVVVVLWVSSSQRENKADVVGVGMWISSMGSFWKWFDHFVYIPWLKLSLLATSNGKMCVTLTSAHTLLHHGLLLPVKYGVRHEALKNYLYLFRSSFLQRSQFISHNPKHACNFSVTELTILCCHRFFQILRCWEDHLETGLFSLLYSFLEETEVLIWALV